LILGDGGHQFDHRVMNCPLEIIRKKGGAASLIRDGEARRGEKGLEAPGIKRKDLLPHRVM
jgi:hypothetical protein